MMLRRTTRLLAAVLAVVFALALASPAGASGNPDYTSPPPSEMTEGATPAADGAPTATDEAAGPGVPSAPAAEADRQWLPITGSDAISLVAMAAVLMAGGAGVLALRRRTPA